MVLQHGKLLGLSSTTSLRGVWIFSCEGSDCKHAICGQRGRSRLVVPCPWAGGGPAVRVLCSGLWHCWPARGIEPLCASDAQRPARERWESRHVSRGLKTPQGSGSWGRQPWFAGFGPAVLPAHPPGRAGSPGARGSVRSQPAVNRVRATCKPVPRPSCVPSERAYAWNGASNGANAV